MSTDQIAQVANSDTPSAVQVPSTLAGVIVWATGRFGGAAVIAGALAFAITRIYADMQVRNAEQIGDLKAQNAMVVELVRSQAVQSGEVVSALRELARSVEAIRTER